MQSLVNLVYGVAAGLGLYFLGVPYALLWASLGAVLRFIPYLGPVLGAGAPILVSLAALEGWAGPLWVTGLFVVLELFTNLVLETVLYAGAAGVSQVALLVSLAFWTWLWGPLGLLMGTPLTVCLVVIGKHVPGLEFVSTLMADAPALAPEYGYYQRCWPATKRGCRPHRTNIRPSPPFVRRRAAPAALNIERDATGSAVALDKKPAVIVATRELCNCWSRSEAWILRTSSTEFSHLQAREMPFSFAIWCCDELALVMLANVVETFVVMRLSHANAGLELVSWSRREVSRSMPRRSATPSPRDALFASVSMQPCPSARPP